MQPATTLKKLLKPPFECESLGAPDCIRIKTGLQRDKPIPLNHIDNISTALLQFVGQALQEKWERDFGERKRWELSSEYGVETIKCPYCNAEYLFMNDDYSDVVIIWKEHQYCPHCGKRIATGRYNLIGHIKQERKKGMSR